MILVFWDKMRSKERDCRYGNISKCWMFRIMPISQSWFGNQSIDNLILSTQTHLKNTIKKKKKRHLKFQTRDMITSTTHIVGLTSPTYKHGWWFNNKASYRLHVVKICIIDDDNNLMKGTQINWWTIQFNRSFQTLLV